MTPAQIINAHQNAIKARAREIMHESEPQGGEGMYTVDQIREAVKVATAELGEIE